MLTPARTRDGTKRASRLTSATFSNPFKRRGSNAAVFTTPSGSDFSFQQLEDIGFADPPIALDAPFATGSPPSVWPPRKPVPRSSKMTPARPDSGLPDSPTLRGPRLPLSRTASTTRVSRIPTPGVRGTNRTSPLKIRSMIKENGSASLVDRMNVDSPQRPPTTTTRAELNRLSSYEIVHHQLLKPKLPHSHSSSNLFALPSPDFKQTAVANPPSPLKLTSSRCVSGSPSKRLKLDTPSWQKQVPISDQHQYSPYHSLPPVLPPIISLSTFDTTMTVDKVPALLDGDILAQKPETTGQEMDSRNISDTEMTMGDKEDVDIDIERFFATSPLGETSVSRDVSNEVADDIDDFPVNHVFEAQSTAYWTGRFMSLHDCLMNEAHALPDPRDVDSEDKMHQLEIARTKQIFFNLQECCHTPSAEASLKVRRGFHAC